MRAGLIPALRVGVEWHAAVAGKNVAHLRCSAIFLRFSQPLRAGLNHSAPTTLRRRAKYKGCTFIVQSVFFWPMQGASRFALAGWVMAGIWAKAVAEPPHSKGSGWLVI